MHSTKNDCNGTGGDGFKNLRQLNISLFDKTKNPLNRFNQFFTVPFNGGPAEKFFSHTKTPIPSRPERLAPVSIAIIAVVATDAAAKNKEKSGIQDDRFTMMQARPFTPTRRPQACATTSTRGSPSRCFTRQSFYFRKMV